MDENTNFDNKTKLIKTNNNEPNVELKWILHGSEDYEQSLNLREEVLRKPLGLRLERELLKEENAGLLTAWKENFCIGTVVLIEEDFETARMKAVAVSPHFQNLGIGKKMVIESENEALRRGYKKIYLHARKNVVSFYEKLGYEAYGEEFTEVTIPHRRMIKNLILL